MSWLKRSRQPAGRQRVVRETPPAMPRAFSYHAQRSDEQLNTGRQVARTELQRQARRLRAFRLHRVYVSAVLVAALVLVLFSLSLSSRARLVTVAAQTGGNYFLHPLSDYQAAADAALSGSLFNHNKLTLNAEGIAQQLKHQFPELADVSVTTSLFSRTPVVYVRALEPALLLKSQSGTFLVAADGTAIAEAAQVQLPKTGRLPLVEDKSGLAIRLHQQTLSAQEVAFIQTVAFELAARHVGIASITLPPGGTELDVHPAGVPYFVKFNLENGSARQQAGTFLATQATLKGEGVTPGVYIDVRLPGRAYYR